MSTPVEITTRYATSVDTLPEAWEFVMARLDSCGGSPSIRITPVWIISEADFGGPTPRRFEVVVEGMTEEATA